MRATSKNSHFTHATQTLEAWSQTPSLCPAISGTFECHIFCAPLHPDPESKARFVDACQKVGIKALCLGLDYEGQGVINVLQSTKYYELDNAKAAVELLLQDGLALSEYFEVIRLKLEAMAWNPGVPVTNEQSKSLPESHYFEYHLKLDAPVSTENDQLLKQLARQLTQELGVRVPFSCNNMGEKNQRFLNARTYGMGASASAAVVAQITEALTHKGFTVQKVIQEFIVFDTNKELDRGWLEF
jgi:hypothetical protein